MSSTLLRTLILEDSRSDALLLIRQLRHADYEVEYEIVDNESDMRNALASDSWDIILSDYSMPNFSATAGLDLLKKLQVDIPFIIVSGTMGEEAAVTAMKAGAQDYFPKGKTALLPVAIEREITEARERENHRKAEEQLRQAEQRFTKAFQVSPMGITISNVDGFFLSVNDSFRKMLQFKGEVVGKSALELGMWENPEDKDILSTVPEDTSRSQNVEVILRTSSGEKKYAEVSTEEISVNDDVCILAMWNDVTARKHAEETLQHSTNLIKLLHETTVIANKSTDIEEILRYAITNICQFAGWPLGHIYMRTRGRISKLISSAVWYADNTQHFSELIAVSEDLEFSETSKSLIYDVYQSGTPHWILNIKESDNFIRSEEAQRAGIKSVFAFPIVSHHVVVAVAEFFSTTSEKIDDSLLNTIPNIALQVGHAIERTNATEELKSLYNATSYLFKSNSLKGLSEQIVHGVVEAFRYVDCGLFLIDEETGDLRRAARTSDYELNNLIPLTLDSKGLVPRAFRTKSVVYAPDVSLEEDYVNTIATTRSEIVVPLLSQTKIIGVLDLQSNKIDNFSISDEKVLVAFAERAASAIEIMRLYEEVHTYANQLEIRVNQRTEELQKAKDRAEVILNNSSDAIVLINAQGEINQTNFRFGELFGYGSDELYQTHVTQLVSAQFIDALTKQINTLSVDVDYVRFEVQMKTQDNTEFPADVALASFADNDEIGIICSIRDITRQKELEQELRLAFEQQKQLTELKTRFISTISHEYRTPLAIIQSSSSLLRQYYRRLSDERRLEHFEKIQSQIGRMIELLDEVLEINKSEVVGIEFNPVLADVKAFCTEIVKDYELVSTTHQLKFTTSGPPKLIHVDKKLFRQIASNLISNAIKYSPDGSTIQIILIFGEQNIYFRVIDEGRGIPREDIPNLFTVFHRASNVGQVAGTGLGLAIVKRAVEAHEGTITVSSELGKGTTFSVSIPILENS